MPNQPMPNKPNLLIILCDQLRRHALSCHGDPNIRTPHLDALANEGVRFDAANSTYPVCVPFRYSMLTGQYAHSRQLPSINWRMSPTEPTLADAFNEAGYHTAYVGKWHLYGGSGPSMFKRPVPRENQGHFEKWYGFEFRNDFFDTVYFEDDSDEPIAINGYQTDGLFDRTIEHLTRGHDRRRPFCCVLSVEAPHPPYEAPDAYAEAWADRELALPPNFMTATHHPPPANDAATADEDRPGVLRDLRTYYAMVQNLDDNVGRMMSALRESELADDTIVVFLSDHGELMGSHGLRQKQYPYEESVGIPLIVWGPGRGIPVGRTVDEPVATEDLLPTFCGLAGVPPLAGLPGVDASPLVRGEAETLSRPGVMLEFVAELRSNMNLYQQTYRGFRSRRYKYTVLAEPREGMRPWQFYDLENDPYELNNLVDDPALAAEARQHHQWLRDRMVETGDHAWLAEAFGIEPLNAWLVSTIRG